MSDPLDITREQALETYKSMISIGTEALRALLLINGGAVVAILAYLGKASTAPSIAQDVLTPIGFFIAGLVVATIAFLTTYLTQYHLFNDFFESERKKSQKHVLWLRVTILISFASVAFFAWGAFESVRAFGRF
jgi:hypothetical protein